jgi:hypothetical protein
MSGLHGVTIPVFLEPHEGEETWMSVAQERAEFNAAIGPAFAAAIGVTNPWKGGSARFSYFIDDQQFVVIAGAQEGSDVDLALARGLSYRAQRQLVLILPQEHAFATLQRTPWLAPGIQPKIYLHDGKKTWPQPIPRQSETITNVGMVKLGVSPQDELREAATAKHLGAGSSSVYDLVEWATTHPSLDAGHRRSERSWHCMGQKVLSIKATGTGILVTAGIHFSKTGVSPTPTAIPKGERLSPAQLEVVKQQVMQGVAARFTGPPPIHRADEHWLQAVIRQDPSLVGVEQPALRELPAWRPGGAAEAPSWGRGYIDLLGVDGHGDIRIVETKLADNRDDLLVFQGLDYYIWAQAYRDVLVERLGVAKGASLEIHYVIGDSTNGKIDVSQHTGAQVRSLDPSIRWRFQTIHDWYDDSGMAKRPSSQLLRAGEVA